ncbi:MAG: peptide chain release factor 1 [Bacteroidia bacterium]
MIDKLSAIEDRFEEVKQKIIDPEMMSDQKKYAKLSKEYKDLEKMTEKIKVYKEAISNLEMSNEMMRTETDPEMKEMAKEEYDALSSEVPKLEEELKLLLIPKDPEDSKNCILEIRGGTGGDEAAIFAGDLMRMYERYASHKKWTFEINDFQEGSAGGYKEIIATVTGPDAFGTLKYESGVHRVQRVPATETQGRIHTSAATVAVMPEAEEFDVDLRDSDIKVDTFCSSGPGGQSVNTTYSAVRLTHTPSGLVVSNQDQKSQIKNKEKAMKILRSRLYDIEYQKRHAESSALRKSQVSTGDRSAKIRTYNYPQGRVTDHRINLTIYNLNGIMNGDLVEITEKLQMAENAEKLQAGE